MQTKIVRYFKYLQGLNFEGKIGAMINRIVIHQKIDDIESYFDDDGLFLDDKDERLFDINKRLN